VLTGFAYNGFVLGWLLLLTAGSRTVSFATLGIYWLLGLWTVVGLEYVLDDQGASILGVEITDDFVPVWLSPFTSEVLKTLAVVLYFVLACRDGRRWPSISDGLLLGFVVGFGFKFHEDAHIGIVTGHGWDAVTPLSTFLPTIELWNDQVYNDHAVRGALEGLSIGAAAMLWHWRKAAWVVGLAGPVLVFWGHVMWNYFVDHPAQAVGGEDAPFLFATLQDVLASGRLPLWVLLVGAVCAVVAESWILRWVGKRDRMFGPLPIDRAIALLRGWNTQAGLTQLGAAERYVTLRRSVYYAGWRAQRAGRAPEVSYDDYAELKSLGTRLGLNLAGSEREGPMQAVPDAGHETGATASSTAGPGAPPAAPDVPL
jgi:hypothetical protein